MLFGCEILKEIKFPKNKHKYESSLLI